MYPTTRSLAALFAIVLLLAVELQTSASLPSLMLLQREVGGQESNESDSGAECKLKEWKRECSGEGTPAEEDLYFIDHHKAMHGEGVPFVDWSCLPDVVPVK